MINQVAFEGYFTRAWEYWELRTMRLAKTRPGMCARRNNPQMWRGDCLPCPLPEKHRDDVSRGKCPLRG